MPGSTSWTARWPEFRDRLDAGGRVEDWGRQEIALAGLRRVEDLTRVTARGADPDQADAVLLALVRLAAADGAADDDALLVVVHLLQPAVGTLCRQLDDLTDDIEATVLGELTCQIRSYPWRRRTRAVAANLQADTRRALLREYRPWAMARPAVRVEFWDPTGWAWQRLIASCPEPGHSDEDVDVVELLRCASARGVPGEDLALLVTTERRRAERPGVFQNRRIAAEHGLPMRTFYHRRERTLAALRAVARDCWAEA